MSLPRNREKPSSGSGFLNSDADEIFCKTFAGQCNVYSLHVVRKSNTTGGDWILVVTLSGRIFRFSVDDPTTKDSFDGELTKIACNETDLRNEFPPQYNDLEIASSCICQFSNNDDGVYLFLAGVDNRAHLADNGGGGGRGANGTVSMKSPGLIFVVKVSAPWKRSSTLAYICRTLATSYSPALIASFSLRWPSTDSERVLLVSASDRSIHGYRIETTGSNVEGMWADQISVYECFLGETFPEFDAFLRRGQLLPGSILQLDIWYDRTSTFDRLLALGFDTGYVSVCQVDVTQNHLIRGPTEHHFDSPVAALKFIPQLFGSSTSSQSGTGTELSLLVCPSVGPARIYTDISEGKWTESPVLNLTCSDHFDCVTCAELITVRQAESDECVNYVVIGTFAGKVLIYALDKERKSIWLKRVHSFLSPVMNIKRFRDNYIVILLTYTLMIFEL